MTTHEQRQAELDARLQDGFEKIGQAMQQGIDVTNWERHWIDLLRQYEQISDELAAHHAGDAPAMQATLPAMPRAEQEAT